MRLLLSDFSTGDSHNWGGSVHVGVSLTALATGHITTIVKIPFCPVSSICQQAGSVGISICTVLKL